MAAAAAAAALAEMKLCAALLAHYFNEWVPSTLTANCSWAPHFLFLLLPMATGHTVLQSAHIHTAFSYHPDELIYFLDCPLIYRLLDRLKALEVLVHCLRHYLSVSTSTPAEACAH